MRRLFVILVAAAAGTAACNDEGTVPSAPVATVASVTLVPASDTVQSGDSMLVLKTARLAAVLKDAGGNVLSVIQTGSTVAWTSSDATVASVAPSGVVTGLKSGAVTITAAIEGKSNTAAIKDSAVTVASVTVKPNPDTVKVKNTVNLKATVLSTAGDTLKTRGMFWTSSDTSVAVVANADSLNVVAPGGTGTISGVKAGTATITAKVGGVSGTATVVVLP